MDILVFWLLLSVVAGVYAGIKGRSSFGWFFISCLVSPVIGLLLVAILPRLTEAPKGLEARLREIQVLLDKGVITQEEYALKRKAIIENG